MYKHYMCYFQLFDLNTCSTGYQCKDGQCIPVNGKDMIYITRNLKYYIYVKYTSEIQI